MFVFFFKQKTAYEMRISDWSSDVCSSDLGSPPEYREFPNGNDEPSRLLRLNVYFDNPVPKKDGTYEDRGGFWAPVEIWHRDAAHWQDRYQKGMRVVVTGRMEREPWTDNDDQQRETWQINARRGGKNGRAARRDRVDETG